MKFSTKLELVSRVVSEHFCEYDMKSAHTSEINSPFFLLIQGKNHVMETSRVELRTYPSVHPIFTAYKQHNNRVGIVFCEVQRAYYMLLSYIEYVVRFFLKVPACIDDVVRPSVSRLWTTH